MPRAMVLVASGSVLLGKWLGKPGHSQWEIFDLSLKLSWPWWGQEAGVPPSWSWGWWQSLHSGSGLARHETPGKAR